jgi:hypothetical protein
LAETRKFETGATRSKDDNKPDYEGFISPLVLERYGQYMHGHRTQVDGTIRASDNWQKGIPLGAYAKSLIRHVFQFWKLYRGHPVADWDTKDAVGMEDILCSIIFNSMGYLHEILASKGIVSSSGVVEKKYVRDVTPYVS